MHRRRVVMLDSGSLTRRSGSGKFEAVARIIDSDQHLYETRSLWADHIDPAARETR